MASVAPAPTDVHVYVSPKAIASMFGAKVVAALDSRHIRHYCHFESLIPEERKLPSDPLGREKPWDP